MLYNFLLIISFKSLLYFSKFSLLSIVMPSSLNVSTTLTNSPDTSISMGSFTLWLVINIKYVFDQLRSSLLNLHQSSNGSNFFENLLNNKPKSASASYNVVSYANMIIPNSSKKAILKYFKYLCQK